jgi:transcription elongation factor Elf1
MNTNVEFTPMMIKCPACDTVQAAICEHTIPFKTYIHDCEICEYTIMESEWDVVNPFIMKPTDSIA